MEYAIVKIQGKQYKVSKGDVLEIDKIDVDQKRPVSFDEVLLAVLGEKVLIGRPKVEGVKVKGVVLESVRGQKIRVAKFKAKSRYRRVVGYRQKLTRVRITEIKHSGRQAQDI